jgi:hypothetical protein
MKLIFVLIMLISSVGMPSDICHIGPSLLESHTFVHSILAMQRSPHKSKTRGEDYCGSVVSELQRNAVLISKLAACKGESPDQDQELARLVNFAEVSQGLSLGRLVRPCTKPSELDKIVEQSGMGLPPMRTANDLRFELISYHRGITHIAAFAEETLPELPDDLFWKKFGIY